MVVTEALKALTLLSEASANSDDVPAYGQAELIAMSREALLEIREAISVGDILALQSIVEQLPANTVDRKEIQRMVEEYDFTGLEQLTS